MVEKRFECHNFVIFTGHYFMAGVDVVVADPGNERAAVALAAFVEICLMQQKVILVRFVKRNNTAPKVGILIPCMKSPSNLVLIVCEISTAINGFCKGYSFRGSQRGR